MCFTSPLNPQPSFENKFIQIHGDAVRDIAMRVDDCKLIWQKAVDRGATSVQPPTEYKDEHGAVLMAALQTYGDTIHTLIEYKGYKGPFLPGFIAVAAEDDPLSKALGDVGLEIIDHCVGNQPDGQMVEVANWYSKMLDFHQFWSVDDTQVYPYTVDVRSSSHIDCR